MPERKMEKVVTFPIVELKEGDIISDVCTDLTGKNVQSIGQLTVNLL